MFLHSTLDMKCKLWNVSCPLPFVCRNTTKHTCEKNKYSFGGNTNVFYFCKIWPQMWPLLALGHLVPEKLKLFMWSCWQNSSEFVKSNSSSLLLYWSTSQAEARGTCRSFSAGVNGLNGVLETMRFCWEPLQCPSIAAHWITDILNLNCILFYSLIFSRWFDLFPCAN